MAIIKLKDDTINTVETYNVICGLLSRPFITVTERGFELKAWDVKKPEKIVTINTSHIITIEDEATT